MLLKIDEFRTRARQDLPGLVLDLQAATGRRTESERRAWSNSLVRFVEVLEQCRLGAVHVQLGQPSSVSLEYRLPAASYWCDVVLLGRVRNQRRALMFELKDWDTFGDQPGPREDQVIHKGFPALHPSDQVRGYVEYCRKFHSEVQRLGAEVVGCSFFTKSHQVGAYVAAPHTGLVQEYPVFTSSIEDL